MDRRQREQARLACQISIGLMAGIFSFLPSVSAAPVHDPNSFTSNSRTLSADKITQNGTTTVVKGTTGNNIVAWKDFSVAKDETVQFGENGTVGSGAGNYLNVVTGGGATPAASQISGTIQGGNDVYIVNPQGVYINKGATVNVGNLYVSTMNAQDAVNNFTNGSTGSAVISGTANAEVVNMGTIKADTVEVHGTDIKFLDLFDVTTGARTDASKLTFNATGEINLGKSQDTSKTNAAYTANQTETIYNVIENKTQLQGIPANATDNYWLKNDIDASGTFTPISGFAGVFDGNFFTINGLTVDTSSDESMPAGLFSTITGADNTNRAKICNLGVKPASIKAADSQYAGGLAGIATNADIKNVFVAKYNDSATIGNETGLEGGILGKAQNVTMDSVYNAANVPGGSGLVAEMAGNVKISNAYNTGKATVGLVTNANTPPGTSSGQENTITNAYDDATQSESDAAVGGTADVVPTNVFSIVKDDATADTANNIYHISDMKTASAYSGSSWSISSNGGENTTWRIYEGQSLPLLRSFLKANGTVTVNYDYQMGDSTYEYRHAGSNGGKDISVVYNHKPLETSNVTYSIASQKGLTNTSGITSVSGLQNVYTNDAKAKAAFYTGQDGYDLVGNNVTITKRSANVGNIPSTPLTKTYDGNANINTQTLKQWLTSGATSTGETDPDTGIIDGDDTVTQNATDLSGKFYLNNSPSKTAGNKDLYIEGSLSVANADGYYNYAITGDAANFGAVGSGTTLTSTASRVYGKILKKDLILSKKDGVTITREYNGKNHNEVADDYRLKSSDSAEAAKTKSDALFKLDGKVSSTTTTTGDSGTTTTTTEDEVYVTTSDSGTGTYGTLSDGTFTATTNAIVGDYDVAYQNLVLSGADAENYNLVQATTDADGNTVNTAVGTNPFYTRGSITQKTINSDSFVIRTSDGSTTPAQKDYDGTSAYELSSGQTLTSTDVVSYPSTTGGATTYDDVQFTPTSARFTTTTNGVTTDAINKGTGYDITYKVNVSGADAGNYKIVNGSTTTSLVSNTPTLDVDVTGSQGSGTINARKLYLKANKGADKSYDGDDKVKVTNTDGTLSPKIAFDGSSDGYVVYNYSGDDAAKHKLVGNDKIELSGTYAGGADVSWTGDAASGYTVAPKDITYTVTVKDAGGNTSSNYEIYTDTSATTATSTLSGVQGKINPRKIVKVLFENTEKTYDGTNTVKGVQTNDKIKITGVTLEDADTLTTNSEGFIQTTDSSGATTDTGTVATIFGTDTSGITGVYGTYDSTANTFAVNQRDGETGTQGGHVKRDADGNVLPQDVQYSNVALSNPRGNYVLDSSTQYGTGTIKPLAISADNITLKLTGQVKKTYDATSKVTTTNDGQNTAKNAKDYIASVTATTASNTSISLTPDLDALGDDDAYFVKTTTADGTTTLTATKDATENNGATGVQYKLKFNTVDNGDYSIGGLDSDNKLTLNGTVDNLASGQTVGRIEKRTLTPTIVQTGRKKEYDATTAVEDASGSTLSGGDVVSFTGWLSNDAGVTNASTGVYTTDGNVWHENDDPDAAVKDHSITYTAAIGAGTDSDTSGNYQIANTTDFTNGVATDATGRINQRETSVTFGKLKKTYDGTTSTDPTATNTALDGTTQAYTFTNLAPNGTDGTADALNPNRLSLSYTSEFANANANSATNPNHVNYTNLALNGAARGNYKLTSTPTTGEGEIDKNTVNSFTVNYTGDAFSKTYDGNANVTYDHSDTAYPTNNPFFDGEKGSDTAEGHINSITLGGVTLTSGYRIDSATYQTNGADSADAGNNKTVKYVFDLNASILDNFDLSGLSSYNSTSNTLTDASKTGTIKQKLIKTAFDDTQGGNVTDSLGNLTGQVTKVYNGSTNVVKNSQTDVKSDAESDTSLFSGKFTVSGLVNNEAQADVVKFSGAYDGKDVGTTNVNYTAATTTGQGANYQIVKSEETTSTPASSVTYTGAGSITPKEISIGFDNVNKIYDTSSSTSSSVQTDGQVVLDSNPKLQESDFVNNEKDQLTDTTGYQNIKGYYVRETADGEVYDDANVEWDSATSQAKNKGVAYTGLAAAFAELQGDNNVLKNYTLKGATENGVAKDVTLNKGKTNEQTLNATSNGIANTVYFDAAKGKGKIRQLSLTMSDIKTRWNDYSRQYNGTSTIDEADYQSALSLYADSASGVSFGGQSIPILYRGTMNFFDIGSNPETEHKNAGTGLGIKATITGLGASSTDNNISVAGLTSDTAGSLLTTYRNTDNGGTTRGTITPRKIVAVSTQTDASKYDKTYDGTKAVEDYAQKVKLAHLNDDGSFDTTTTIAGDGTTATLNGAAYASKNAGTRAIYYDATLTNNDAGNYELVTNADGKQAVLVGADTLTKDADGNTVTKQTKGSELEGTINKRTVYVGFTGGTPTNIDKTYGETTITNVTSDNYDTAKKEVLNPDTYRNQIDVKAKTNTTGIVDSDANDVTLNRSAINAAYADGNVHRKSDGTADKQDVNFTNFVLTDSRNAASDDYADPMSNYDVKVSDDPNVTALIGKGTISPKNIVVKVDNSPNVKKIYDGTDALGSFTENGTTTSNLDTLKANAQIDGTQMMLGESVNDLGFEILDSDAENGSSYASAHTNAYNNIENGKMGVNYSTLWTNKNYDLTFEALNAEDTDAGAGHPLTVTATSNPWTTQDADGNDVNHNGTATFTVNQGTISPRQLRVTGATDASKTYDGTTAVRVNGDGSASAVGTNLTFEGVGNSGILTDDDVQATATGTYQDVYGGDAADATDGTNTLTHGVKYTDIALENKDYELTGDTETTGQGTIDRRTLVVKGKQGQSVKSGESPVYSGEITGDGTTTGWANDADKEALEETLLGKIKWYKKPGQATSGDGTVSSVYGWYRDEELTKTTGTAVPAVTDDDGNVTAYDTTTTVTNAAGQVLWQMVVRTDKDPSTASTAPDNPVTITTLSTTITRTNPITGDYYTTEKTGATGQTVTTLTTKNEDGTYNDPVTVSSLEDWYGFNRTSSDVDMAYLISDSLQEAYGKQDKKAFDKNYQLVQDEGNETAVHYVPRPVTPSRPSTPSNPSCGGGGGSSTPTRPTTPVTPVTPSTPTVTPVTPTVPDAPDPSSDINAAKKFVPNSNAYNNASHDEVQSVIRSGQVGLEYASGGINVASETGMPDVSASGTDNASIGVQNSGTTVNLSGGDAMVVKASRIDITGDDTFTITSDAQTKEGSAAVESTGAQTHEGSAAVETADAGTYDGSAAVESAGARTDLQSTTDASWLFGDEASASERQSGTSSSSSSSSEDEGTSLFSRSYDDDETAARSAISVMTADDTESAEDTEDAKDKDKDEESKDAESSDAADDSSIGIESEGSGVNVAS